MMIAHALSRLGAWLAARPDRLTVVNALLLTAILILLGSADLFRFVGGSAVLLCAAAILVRTLRRMDGNPLPLHPYDLAVMLAPPAIAAALAVLAIILVVGHAPGSFAHTMGLVLFTIEFALLALGASDGAPEAARA
ncbi:hypothetical protein [Xanthobacter aminoxidans]|uniref:Uncharacterized protein n=1 Tax=Xanthobacter aminoxidans TaxID=186280 RepID=A0ABW6ZJB9_9HYPH